MLYNYFFADLGCLHFIFLGPNPSWVHQPGIKKYYDEHIAHDWQQTKQTHQPNPEKTLCPDSPVWASSQLNGSGSPLVCSALALCPSTGWGQGWSSEAQDLGVLVGHRLLSQSRSPSIVVIARESYPKWPYIIDSGLGIILNCPRCFFFQCYIVFFWSQSMGVNLIISWPNINMLFFSTLFFWVMLSTST